MTLRSVNPTRLLDRSGSCGLRASALLSLSVAVAGCPPEPPLYGVAVQMRSVSGDRPECFVPRGSSWNGVELERATPSSSGTIYEYRSRSGTFALYHVRQDFMSSPSRGSANLAGVRPVSLLRSKSSLVEALQPLAAVLRCYGSQQPNVLECELPLFPKESECVRFVGEVMRHSLATPPTAR